MSAALRILRHPPDLADAIVFANGKFDVAYQKAKRRKEVKALTEANQARLQAGPDPIALILSNNVARRHLAKDKKPWLRR